MPEHAPTGAHIGETPESAPVQQTPQQPAQARPMQQQGDTGRRPDSPRDNPADGRHDADGGKRDAPSPGPDRDTQVRR